MAETFGTRAPRTLSEQSLNRTPLFTGDLLLDESGGEEVEGLSVALGLKLWRLYAHIFGTLPAASSSWRRGTKRGGAKERLVLRWQRLVARFGFRVEGNPRLRVNEEYL